MNDDNTTPQSGSRWEPRPDSSGAPMPPPVPPAEGERTTLAGNHGANPPSAPESPATTDRPSWAARATGRGGLLAGAAALVLVAGVGGFAVAEVAHHPDGGSAPFGVGYQPQDAGFRGLPPSGGDDGGLEGHGDDDGGQLGGQPGGQLGGSDDDGAQQGSSL